MLQNL
ncbi:hypothetical protein AYI68_g6904, partial [Smittium mucronatum]